MPNAEPSLSAPAARNAPFLIWEDADTNNERWWLARAHEATEAGRDFFVAEDDVTDCLVGVMRPARGARFHVVAVLPLQNFAGRASAVAEIKGAVVRWLADPTDTVVRSAVSRWRLGRAMKILRRNLPTILAGFAIGAMLGLFVALFAVSSGLVGWPMMLAGLTIGALAGPTLKFIVDRRAAQARVGFWARFAIVTVAAIAGAAVTTGSVLTLFWD